MLIPLAWTLSPLLQRTIALGGGAIAQQKQGELIYQELRGNTHAASVPLKLCSDGRWYGAVVKPLSTSGTLSLVPLILPATIRQQRPDLYDVLQRDAHCQRCEQPIGEQHWDTLAALVLDHGVAPSLCLRCALRQMLFVKNSVHFTEVITQVVKKVPPTFEVGTSVMTCRLLYLDHRTVYCSGRDGQAFNGDERWEVRMPLQEQPQPVGETA